MIASYIQVRSTAGQGLTLQRRVCQYSFFHHAKTRQVFAGENSMISTIRCLGYHLERWNGYRHDEYDSGQIRQPLGVAIQQGSVAGEPTTILEKVS
jgi:hypothetical protein